MKKVLLFLGILMMPKIVLATHLFGTNAANITQGIMDNARLDKSSITMLGPLQNTTFYIAPNGNVGIGTTNPKWKFHVFGDSVVIDSGKTGGLGILSGRVSIGEPDGVASSALDISNGSITIRGGNSIGISMIKTGGGTPTFGVGTQGASSAIDVVGGSITVRGANNGVYVTDLGSVSAQALEARGSTITVGSYNLVFPTAPVAGQHLFAAQVNGNNVVIAGGGDNAGSAGGASAQNSTQTWRMGYSGSLLMSTATVCGWFVACFNTFGDTINVMGIDAAVVLGSTVGATMFDLWVATEGATALMASTTYFPQGISIATRAANGGSHVHISTGAGAMLNQVPLVLPPWVTVGVRKSTMAISGDLDMGLKIGITGWVAGK